MSENGPKVTEMTMIRVVLNDNEKRELSLHCCLSVVKASYNIHADL